MKKVKITIIVEYMHETKLLTHAEYQTFRELSKGEVFDIAPKGSYGVEVTASNELWQKLGY